MNIVLVCVLPILSIYVLLFSLYKAYWLNKQQKQAITSALHQDELPTRNTIGKKIHKYLRTFIVSFECLLFLIGFNLAFTPATSNGHIAGKDSHPLKNGKIAYHIDDTMRMDKYYNVTVSITKSHFDSVLFGNLERAEFEVQKVGKITSVISMSLIDPTRENFVINSISTEEQIVDNKSNSIWQWSVKPTKGGNSELVLKVTVKQGNNKKDACYKKVILVKTSIFQEIKRFIVQNWQYIVTAIIIPVLGFLGNKIWAAINKHRNKRNPIGFNKDKK